MKITKTERGFELTEFLDINCKPCSLQQSSAIGDYPDAFDRPGTSRVWLGIDDFRMHLSREQVEALLKHLQAWLQTGSFVEPTGS